MRFSSELIFLATMGLPLLLAGHGRAQDESGNIDRQIIQFLENNCLKCHGVESVEADINIKKLIKDDKLFVQQDLIKEIQLSVESGLMPPEDAELEVSLADREAFVHNLAQRSQLSIPHEKTFRMRRMNKNEFVRTVTHLFRMRQPWFNDPNRIVIGKPYFQPDKKKLPKNILALSYSAFAHRVKPPLRNIPHPPDDSRVAHGFTNQQSGLSTSPLLLEKYFQIANGLIHSQDIRRASALEELLAVDVNATIQSESARGVEKLKKFLPRAFRRPVLKKEMELYAQLFQTELKQSGSYTDAMKSTLLTVLVSPGFLFRDDLAMQSDGFKSKPHYAVASRLSFFLWGSMPDAELFECAENGKLDDEEVLSKQVDRMMGDRKIENLSVDFASQWLKLKSVHSAQPDPETNPEYYRTFSQRYNQLSTSMMIEQLLLFEAIMIEDRSILEFINPEFSYLNADLIRHYGLNDKKSLGFRVPRSSFEEFFRIELDSKETGGILTSSAMLLSTSTPTRTSPVSRGAWVLEVLFNRPPPPPPGAVPEIQGKRTTSADNIQDRLAEHRESKACAICHDLMDPYGLVFENYDATGKRRVVYRDGTIVSTTQVIRGKIVTDAVDFKRKLVAEKEAFVRGFIEHMLKYALGRKLLPRDRLEIDRITEQVIADGCRFKSVIKRIVLSKLFRHGFKNSVVLDSSSEGNENE